MMVPRSISLLSLVLALALAPRGTFADEALPPGYGPNPVLPAPDTGIIPTVKVAKAVGWRDGGKPTPAEGLEVAAFASGLKHPRWLYVLPNGDVLVAETDAPAKSADNRGIKGFFVKYFMKSAGSGTRSANQITLLRGLNAEGAAAERHPFLTGLNSPLGMALVGEDLYVANTDALMRFTYHDGDTRITAPGLKVADLPAGPINHHWTKNVIASPDGSRLYVTVGSNSNIAENGIAAERDRAAILEIDPKTGERRVYASGLRNPNGLAYEPTAKTLWTVVNERDELGNDLVPDYLTSLKEGAFYGWPYSYFGPHVDERVSPRDFPLVQKAIAPDYGLGAHTASLGLAFSSAAKLMPAHFASGAFIGQHGSWNRKPPSGYKVIFVPFAGGKPAGMPEDVLTGFLTPNSKASGRPVGVAIAKDGALLVADDVGNTIWRVTSSGRTSSLAPAKP
jgi:glucose/arabinose dehydrogenase